MAHGRFLGLAVAGAMVVAPGAAHAGSDFWATLGVGTTMGMAQHNGSGQAPVRTFTGELSAQARLLYVFGIETSYAPTDRLYNGDRLVYDSRLKLSAVLHIAPTTPVGGYLKAGVGGSRIDDMLTIGKNSESYHAGAGVEVHFKEHWVVGAEVLLMVPGFNRWSLMRGVKVNDVGLDQWSTLTAPEAIRALELDLNTGSVPTPDVAVSWQDILGGATYRVALSLRYYL